MPKANEVARELRNLADCIDRLGDAETDNPAIYLNFKYGDEMSKKKEQFLALVRVLPRPLEKEADTDDYIVRYRSDAMQIRVVIERSKVCHLIAPAQPAQYKCEPLLSEEEEAELGDHPSPHPTGVEA